MRGPANLKLVTCPPDGPQIMFNPQTGEKYANCFACSRCGCCARGAAVPVLSYSGGL